MSVVESINSSISHSDVAFRFFVLNNEAGLLEYFVNEQSRPQKPRGMLPLAGAVISPSDEDSHTFTVNAISGEQYKLRGVYQKVYKTSPYNFDALTVVL